MANEPKKDKEVAKKEPKLPAEIIREAVQEGHTKVRVGKDLYRAAVEAKAASESAMRALRQDVPTTALEVQGARVVLDETLGPDEAVSVE